MVNQLEWHLKRFSDLTLEQLYEIIKARIDVFVVEQACPYKECDDLDRVCYHLFQQDDKGITAYARIIPPGQEFEEAALGRVLTRKDMRGTGYGYQLMDKVMDCMIHDLGYHPIRIEAQHYLEGFYQKYRFRSVSEPYLLDGIWHVEMFRDD